MKQLKLISAAVVTGLLSTQAMAAGWTLDMGTVMEDTIANLGIAAAVLVAIACAALGVRKVLSLIGR